MKHRIRRHVLVISAAALFALAAGVFVSTVTTFGADDDKGILGSLLSRALSTPTTRVSIGAVEGALSSSATIRNVSIADKDGVWLELDQARIVWTRSALLLRRLEIDELEIGTLTIHRQPAPAEDPGAVSSEPVLPELPVKVQVRDFRLQTLALGEPVVGTAARLSANGHATLGNPSEGLDLQLDLRRLDMAGALSAKLGLVPQSSRLDLALKVEEPANGLVVSIANVPGRPPLNLDLNGTGSLDDFTAKLAFAAGADIGAQGSAELRRQGAGRQLGLDLDARIEGLLPEIVGPAFAGVTQLRGTVGFADNSAVDIPSLSVVSQTARLDINGSVSADQVAALKIAARTVPNAGQRTSAGGADIGSLNFDAAIDGALAGPRVVATVAIGDARTKDMTLQSLTARFTATPSGAVTDAATAIPFEATAQADGVELTDPALARAIGRSLSLQASGTMRDGIATVPEAWIRTGTAEARYSGQVGQALVKGRLSLQAPDLAQFAQLADLQLRGQLGLTADLDGVPKDSRMSAVLDGRVSRFASGIARVDGLTGGEVTLAGTVRTLPADGFGFSALRLAGQHVAAQIDGDATATQANVNLQVTVPDLARADKELAGRAEVTGKMTGTVEHPDISATATLTDVRVSRRPIPRLVVQADATDVTGMLNARVSMDGTVDGRSANGKLQVAKRKEGGWLLDGLDLRVGSVTASGALTLDATSLAAGKLTVNAGNLDDVSPLLMTSLAGQLSADVELNVMDGGQNGSLTARGSGLKAAGAAINRIDARAAATDLYRKPVINGDVSVDRATVAGQDFTQVRLTSRGNAAASDITLSAQALGFALETRGSVVPSTPVRLDLAQFSARRDRNQITLARPTSLSFSDGGVAVRELTLAIGSGRLTMAGRAGANLDLTLDARALPLAAADIAVPGLGLAGTLDANAKITGAAAQPSGTWSLRVAGLTAPQTRSANIPPIAATANGVLTRGRTTVDGTVQAQRAGNLRITGSAQLERSDIDLAARGQLDAAVANSVLGVNGQRVTGNVQVDLRARGAAADPTLEGSLAMSGGSFTDEINGVRLTGISGRLAARGDSLVVERLTAQTANSGSIDMSGRVQIDPKAGLPADLRITGRQATLISNDIVDGSANLDLKISGPLLHQPTFGGRIDILSMHVTIPERLPVTTQPIPGTRHVAPPRNVAKRLNDKAKANGQAKKSSFDVTLDLVINAPNRIFVRGRGMNAELGGNLRLGGRMSNPSTVGGFEMVRGYITIGSRRLDFTRGNLDFSGDLMPDLDFEAQTQAADITAKVQVTGPAAQPQFAFVSEPDMPQDEVLSRLLYNNATGGLSPIQALQIAGIAAQFSGGGSDVFDRMRRSLGVDSVDVSRGNSGETTLGVSKAINDRISVGVKGGMKPEDSGVTVNLDVSRRFRLQGEMNSDGSTAVGVGAEWEY